MDKIRVLYVTSILCRHEITFWDTLSNYDDISLIYLSTRSESEGVNERYSIGTRPYHLFSSSFDIEQISQFIKEADYIFVGAVEDDRLLPLLKNNEKLIPIKEHFSRFRPFFPFFPIEILRRIKFYIFLPKRLSFYNRNNYVFCNSFYTSKDFLYCGFYKEKLLRFCYFPPVVKPSIMEISKKDLNSILFVGRDISCKHPKVAIKFCKIINSFGYDYHLQMCGEGLKKYTTRYTNISYIKPVPNEQLLRIYLKSSIFIFPSDRREGFGVVLLEALASGCIVFANEKAGATKLIINDKVNGFIFKNSKDLKKKIKYFLNLSDYEIMEIRLNAVSTIFDMWNGKNGAERTHLFLRDTFSGRSFTPFESGPLSRAK